MKNANGWGCGSLPKDELNSFFLMSFTPSVKSFNPICLIPEKLRGLHVRMRGRWFSITAWKRWHSYHFSLSVNAEAFSKCGALMASWSAMITKHLFPPPYTVQQCLSPSVSSDFAPCGGILTLLACGENRAHIKAETFGCRGGASRHIHTHTQTPKHRYANTRAQICLHVRECGRVRMYTHK